MFRAEHPKPQFERKDWINLNGEWDFLIDAGESGIDRKAYSPDFAFDQKINVPFCPESKLSGIENKDFMSAVWYKRTFNVPSDWLLDRVFVHFGGVDYHAKVFVNGKFVGEHKGGYASFKLEITDFLSCGENTLTVMAIDHTRDIFQPTGKQCLLYDSFGAWYTRTTGIWQTVWLEKTPKDYIESVKYYPNIDACSLTVMAKIVGSGSLSAKAILNGKVVGESQCTASNGTVTFTINLTEKLLWQAGKGGLYDLELTFNKDKVKSYFGLRDIKIDGRKVLINGEKVFQRLVLDQGFYPDGVYTAPTEADLVKDIEISMAMGFNGARLHQKVFEERFLYHADRLGYIVWGEYGNWNLNISFPESVHNILPEWIEILERDFNHPSIVGWSPFNETWWFNSGRNEESEIRRQCNDVIRTVYLTTKAIDSTRPVIDTSGGLHIDKTDIMDTHNYTADGQEMSRIFADIEKNDTIFDFHEDKFISARGLPVFLSEYGGIKWSNDKTSWGYGNAPKTEQEFFERLENITTAVLDNKDIFAFCYTQLYDVENEQNGLYTYDRTPKFDNEKIKAIIGAKAKYEE